jgi:hypothetical protein
MKKKTPADMTSLPAPDLAAKPDLLVDGQLVDELPGNPNLMDSQQVDQLVSSISMFGFCQPITVVPQPGGGRYWLVDGAHRIVAATRIGITRYPACLLDVPAGQDAQQVVRAGRMALNRIRGLVDLSAAALDVRHLLDSGWRPEALQACGFDEGELQALLAGSPINVDGLDMQDATDGSPLAEQPVRERHYGLTLQFVDRQDRDEVKQVLQSMGPTCEVGLLELIKMAKREK